MKTLKQALKERFSSSKEVQLQWLMPWVYLLSFFAMAYFLIALLLPQQDLLWIDMERWVYLGAFLLIYGISYRLNSHPLEVLESKPKKKGSPAKSNLLSESQAADLVKTLKHYFTTEKPYLEAEIKSSDLCDYLQLNRHELSELLNQHLGMNFYDLINSYRIEEVKKKLEDPKNNSFTILALAFDAGFNSKTTFNTLFKKNTGITPSQFRKKVQSDRSERSGDGKG